MKENTMRLLRAAAVLELVALCMPLAGCDRGSQVPHGLAGDPERGRLLLRQYGCASCHTIPGVATARGNVGPPLGGVGQRVYLGGVVTNTPQNMVAWIRAPQKFDPLTAMPDLQVSEAHAQDMVAYLYRVH
jgi:cytochrome c